jgi:hypothetical protein
VGTIVTDQRGITGTQLAERLFVKPETGEIFYVRDAQKRGRRLIPAGYIKPGLPSEGGGYRMVSFAIGYRRYRKLRASHIVWAWVHGEWPDGEIDHKSTNRADDSIDNLRPASTEQNRTNRSMSKTRSSGFKWVTRGSGNNWVAQIEAPKSMQIDGKRRVLFRKQFPTPEEAHAAACEFAKGLHGEWFNPGTVN